MRKIIFISFFVSLGFLQAQNFKLPADTEFFYFYGGTDLDEGRSIKEIPGGGYIIAGTSSSFGQGNTSVYLIKTDSLGKHVWSSTFGGTQNDWGYSVEVTPDSGYFVAGYSNSFNPPNGFDAYYFKTDKNGILQWEKTVSGNSWDFIYGSAPMADGGFILCGETFTNSNGGTDAYLIRLNKNGDTLWTKHYGGLFDEQFNSVCVINNKLYAVGKNTTHATDTVSDGWLVKLDTNGVILNEAFVSYAHHYEEIIEGITPYNGGYFHFCGRVNAIDSGSTGPLIFKCDTSLTMVEIPTYPDFSPGVYLEFQQIVNISYGSICIIGANKGGSGGTGMFFIGFDKNGITINDYYPTDGGSQDDYGYSLVYTSKGKIVGVGGTQSTNEFCTSTNFGNTDVFLVRYDSDSIHTAGVKIKSSCFNDTLGLWVASVKNFHKDVEFTLAPNPASDYFELQFTNALNEKYEVSIYSLLGEKIRSWSAEGNMKNKIDISAFSPGSYLLKIEDSGGRTAALTKFIVNR